MNEVRWGEYLQYEGPWVPGKVPFVQVPNPDFLDVCLEVFTATEGGRYDAINMYDRCIVSVGLIQWCEATQMSVSDMLGQLVDLYTLDAFPKLRDRLRATGYTFQRVGSKWRFFHGSEMIDTLPEQQRLFLLDSPGKKGTWGATPKNTKSGPFSDSCIYAMQWAATLSEVFGTPEGQAVQRQYTKPRILKFVMPAVKKDFFDTPWFGPEADRWYLAAQAAYLSFAGNNPTIAARQYAKWAEDRKGSTPRDWCIGLLNSLTFAGVGIYPHRYDKIRPVLEQRFGLDLPDLANDLRKVQLEGGCMVPQLSTSNDVQHALQKLGFDLGPRGIDGIWGPKSRAALSGFQQMHGLVATGEIDRRTQSALWGVLLARGLVT